MSERLTKAQVLERADLREQIVPQIEVTPHTPTEVNRTFELPVALYAVTVGCYLGFLALMFATFTAPVLGELMVIFALSIVAGFGVPTIWTKLAPEKRSFAMNWDRFRIGGIETLTGRLTAGEASAQVLTLPILVLAWGGAVAVIAAIV